MEKQRPSGFERGRFVREIGFEASPSKLKALREVKSPSNAKELKSVLGLLR